MLSEGPSTAAPTPTRGGLGGLGPLERGRGWPRGRGGFRTPPEQGRSGGPTGEGWPALPEEPYSPSAPGTRALRRGRKRVSLPRETERGSRRRGARGEREDRFVSAGAGARLPGAGPPCPPCPPAHQASEARAGLVQLRQRGALASPEQGLPAPRDGAAHSGPGPDPPAGAPWGAQPWRAQRTAGHSERGGGGPVGTVSIAPRQELGLSPHTPERS